MKIVYPDCHYVVSNIDLPLNFPPFSYLHNYTAFDVMINFRQAHLFSLINKNYFRAKKVA